MAKNSCRKGKTGEREWAHWLTDRGIPARRGQQFKGTDDSPDVVAEMPGWHPEVKRVEQLNIHDAVEKAAAEAAPGTVPYVAHRKNRREWLVTLRAEDWLRLATKTTTTSSAAVLYGEPAPSTETSKEAPPSS